MFRKHVKKELSAYCHGELAVEESRRVAEHLLKCERCRKEYDEIKLGVRLAQHLPQISAPDSLWGEIESALRDQSRKPAFGSRPSRTGLALGWYGLAAASAVLVLTTVIGVIWYRNYSSRASWPVEALQGNPRVDSDRIGKTGRIREGELLETDGSSRARIDIGMIGEAEVDPNSRVRLVEADITEHRLALDRGRLQARVIAPPRLFFVNTPSAVAVDLGCAYTLEVDDAGNSFLHVTSGKVAFEWNGQETFVPVGAMCQTRVGVGPGTPYFANASDLFIEALMKFDFEGGGTAALETVLAEARDKDTFTLWNLLSRVDDAQRVLVVDRMIELVELPKGVTRQGMLGLDKDMLKLSLWEEELDTVWYQ